MSSKSEPGSPLPTSTQSDPWTSGRPRATPRSTSHMGGHLDPPPNDHNAPDPKVLDYTLPNPGSNGLTLVDVGPILAEFGPTSVDAGSNLVVIGRIWPTPGEIWHLPKTRPNSDTTFGRNRLELRSIPDQAWWTPVIFGRASGEFGRFWAEVGWTWSISCLCPSTGTANPHAFELLRAQLGGQPCWDLSRSGSGGRPGAAQPSRAEGLALKRPLHSRT